MMDNDTFDLTIGESNCIIDYQQYTDLTIQDLRKIIQNPPPYALYQSNNFKYKIFNRSTRSYISVDSIFPGSSHHDYITLYDTDRITLCPAPGFCDAQNEKLIMCSTIPETLKDNSLTDIQYSHAYIPLTEYNVYSSVYIKKTVCPFSCIPVFAEAYESPTNNKHLVLFAEEAELSSPWKEFLDEIGISLDSETIFNTVKMKDSEYIQIVDNLEHASDLETVNLFMKLGFSFYQNVKFKGIYNAYITSIFKILNNDKL